MKTSTHYKNRHNTFMPPKRQLSLIKFAVITLMITITGSGCALSKYKLAKKDTPPPTEMNLSLGQSPIEVLLHSVIIYKGPGSWKRKAYWDEYIVSIANQAKVPLSIELATLVDFQDKHNVAGNNPWELEKQSKAWWKGIRGNGLGSGIAIGAGTGVSAMALIVGGYAGLYGSSAGASVALIGAAGVVILPVVGVSYIIGNIKGRSKIETEFERRRLVLPVTIPVGQVVQGSLFFPITPGPKYLILHYQMGVEEHDMEFDLLPLKTLHIKEEEDKPKKHINE